MSLAAANFRREALLLGDSITQYGFAAPGGGAGWVGLLADAYQRKCDVTNRGYSGYTTRTLFPVAERVLGAAKAAGTRFVFSTVFLGANDANQDAGTRVPAQHVPLEEYEARLTQLLRMAAAASDAVVCIAPPPVDQRRWPSRGNAHVAAYTRAAERAAQAVRGEEARCAVLFVPLLRLMGAAAAAACEGGKEVEPREVRPGDRSDDFPWLAHLSDGLHLSAQGNAFLAEAILKALALGAPHCTPAALPLDYPLFGDIAQASAAEAAEALGADGAALRAFHESQARHRSDGVQAAVDKLTAQAAAARAQAAALDAEAAAAQAAAAAVLAAARTQ